MTVSTSRPDSTAGAAELDLAQLRAAISGRVIGPNDDDYDALRTVVMGGIDRRPAVIVRVANDDDVKVVVATARQTGLDLAIRSGGHSAKGDGTTDGGIVLDLRDMKALDIDPVAKTAWAETGLTAAEVTTAAAEHGLAIGFGDTGSVGIGGITTGGGVGYLVRKHGLTIDNLLAADVVTADGQLVRADKDTNPDLFWAIRGGGGNFGVVTRFQYRLVDLPGIVGGILVLPVNAEIIERYIALSEEAPEELSSIANVMPCPPLPGVPEEWLGKLGIFALMSLRGRGRGRPEGAPAVPRPREARRPRRADRRHAPADDLPRDVLPGGRRPTTTRSRSARTCCSIGATGRSADGDHGAPRGPRRPDARRAAAGPRRRDGARPERRHRVRAPGQPDHGQPRRVLRGRGGQARRSRRGWRSSRARFGNPTAART